MGATRAIRPGVIKWIAAVFTCILAFGSGQRVIAQLTVPLNREINERVESQLMEHQSTFFSCAKPYNEKSLRAIVPFDSVCSFVNGRRRSTWFGRKLFQESFLQVDSPGYRLRIDPLFDLLAGKEPGNARKLLTNTRGLRIGLRIGKTLGIESSLYESQEFFPQYWDAYIYAQRVVPGQGRTKRYRITGWDFAYSQGYVRWMPGRHLILEIGQGKNFLGDGYRSLWLSDVATNYPFIKMTLRWKNFQYTRIVASFMNVDYHIINKDLRTFPKKTANFHLLSINVVPKLQCSLFEGTVLKNPYNHSHYLFNYDLLDPVPFTSNLLRNPSASGTVNSVEGLNLKWMVSRHIQLYNQWAFNDLFGNDRTASSSGPKYGVQAGIKYFNVLGLNNLYMQAEYNRVMPYMYSGADTTMAYTQYGQPLADPLGANFQEGIGIVNYRYHRWFAEYMTCVARYGMDAGTELSGHNILEPDPGVHGVFLQGIETTLRVQQFHVSWYLNPATNMCLSAGMYFRDEASSQIHNSTRVLYLSFTTNLRNIYYDF